MPERTHFQYVKEQATIALPLYEAPTDPPPELVFLEDGAVIRCGDVELSLEAVRMSVETAARLLQALVESGPMLRHRSTRLATLRWIVRNAGLAAGYPDMTASVRSQLLHLELIEPSAIWGWDAAGCRHLAVWAACEVLRRGKELS